MRDRHHPGIIVHGGEQQALKALPFARAKLKRMREWLGDRWGHSDYFKDVFPDVDVRIEISGPTQKIELWGGGETRFLFSGELGTKQEGGRHARWMFFYPESHTFKEIANFRDVEYPWMITGQPDLSDGFIKAYWIPDKGTGTGGTIWCHVTAISTTDRQPCGTFRLGEDGWQPVVWNTAMNLEAPLTIDWGWSEAELWFGILKGKGLDHPAESVDTHQMWMVYTANYEGQGFLGGTAWLAPGQDPETYRWDWHGIGSFPPEEPEVINNIASIISWPPLFQKDWAYYYHYYLDIFDPYGGVEPDFPGGDSSSFGLYKFNMRTAETTRIYQWQTGPTRAAVQADQSVDVFRCFLHDQESQWCGWCSIAYNTTDWGDHQPEWRDTPVLKLYIAPQQDIFDEDGQLLVRGGIENAVLKAEFNPLDVGRWPLLDYPETSARGTQTESPSFWHMGNGKFGWVHGNGYGNVGGGVFPALCGTYEFMAPLELGQDRHPDDPGMKLILRDNETGGLRSGVDPVLTGYWWDSYCPTKGPWMAAWLVYDPLVGERFAIGMSINFEEDKWSLYSEAKVELLDETPDVYYRDLGHSLVHMDFVEN